MELLEMSNLKEGADIAVGEQTMGRKETLSQRKRRLASTAL
jgi:hypothetical protein